MRILAFAVLIFLSALAISQNIITAFFAFFLIFVPFALVYGFPKRLHPFSSSMARVVVMSILPILLYMIFANSANLTLKEGLKVTFSEGVITYSGILHYFRFYFIVFIAAVAIYFCVIAVARKLEVVNKG